MGYIMTDHFKAVFLLICNWNLVMLINATHLADEYPLIRKMRVLNK
jgi:hypothetical protein